MRNKFLEARIRRGKRIKIFLTLERFKGSELRKAMDRLLTDLANASNETRSNAINLLKCGPELCRLESGIASGAKITFLLEPSDFLLDICVAVRTGEFNNLVVGNEHGFSFVENELVELPILSTSEKPTDF
jgi:hypothetical protein